MADKKLRLEVEAKSKGDGFKKAEQGAKDAADAIELLTDAAELSRAELKQTEDALQSIEAAASQFSQEMLDLDDAVRKSGRRFEAHKAVVIRLKTEYTAMRKEGGHSAEAFENLSKRIDQAQEREQLAINETRELLKALDDLQGETGQTVREIDDFNKILDDAEGYINGMGTAAKQQSKDLNRIGDEVNGVGDQVERAGNKIDDLGDRTERAAKKASIMSSLYTKGLDLIQDGLQEAARAAYQFMQDSNQSFLEFDAGARQIFTLIPNLSDTVKKKLQQDAIDIGKEMGRLPEEMLPALYQALSLGIPQDNIFDEVRIASEAARAGGAELEQTLVTGQSIVNAYGADVYDLGQVYDVLFTVVKNGAVTFDDLNSGMSAITSVAGEAHVPLEDIGAAIITMTKQGDSFAEVSSILSNVLGQLAIEGSTAGAAFKEIAGISFTAFMDQGHSLTDALILMDDAAKEAGISILQMVGGDSPFMRDIEAARGLAELTGRHIEEMGEASALTYDSMGNMAEAAAEVGDSMQYADAQTEASTEALKIHTGEAIEPARRAWLDLKTAVVDYFDADAQRVTQIRASTEALEAQGVETLLLKGYMEAIVGTNSSWRDSMVSAEEMALRTNAATEILSSGFQGGQIELARLIDEQLAAEARADSMTRYYENMSAALAVQNEELANSAAAQAQARVDAFAFNDSMQITAGSVGQLNRELLNVTEVLDGDTLRFEQVDGEIGTLRFRNINTAEIAHDGEAAMPWGEEALEFTQDWVSENPVQIEAGLSRESYGRIIASVPELEEELIRQGLAIPLPATLSEDPEKAAEFQALVMEAAAAGVGMFEDEALAARVLSGELVDLGAYYEEMAAQAEAEIQASKDRAGWYAEAKSIYQSTIPYIDELMTAQSQLTAAQGDGAEEAQARVTAAQEDIQQSYRDTALAAFEAAIAQEQGAAGLQSFLALQVELGNLTQEQADARVEMANMTIEAEELGGSQAFLALTTEQQATALDLLAGGYVTSAEQATLLAGQYTSHLNPEMVIAAETAELLVIETDRLSTQQGVANQTSGYLQGSIAGMSEKAATATGNMANLAGNVAGVGSNASTAAGQVGNLRSEIDSLRNKTVTITVETKQVGSQSLEDFLGEPDTDAQHSTGTGGWVTVPEGYPDDSYTVGLTSGEKYFVDPDGRLGNADPTSPVSSIGAGAGAAAPSSLTIHVEVNGYPEHAAEQIGADTKDRVLEAAQQIGFTL